MRSFTICTTLLVATLQISTVQALDPESDSSVASELLAQQGKGVITQDMFSARAASIPAEIKQEVLRDYSRFQGVLSAMLLNSQLAADARAAGFDKQAMTASRMQLAAEAELAVTWLQHYIDIQPDADYELLAREYYLLNPDEFQAAETVDVSHILIDTKKHSDAEALQLATTLHGQVMQDPALFDQLILQHSEDPSVASNQGRFLGVKRGDMVKPFEDIAFTLKSNEISAPVKSEFGYHIVRLDGRATDQVKDFEEVKSGLIDQERERHEARVKRIYLNSLKAQEKKVSTAALDILISRLLDDTEQAGDGGNLE